jgi:hypothetical protein
VAWSKDMKRNHKGGLNDKCMFWKMGSTTVAWRVRLTHRETQISVQVDNSKFG